MIAVKANELGEAEAAGWWSALTELWPAFADEFAASGERTLFILEPEP